MEHLKKITKVSSAQLAAHNHYTLDETVRDMVFERNAAIDAAHAAVEQRKQEAERKKNEAVQAALKKFELCPNGLTVPELKSLVVAVSNSDDSPVKKKKSELQEQLYREPRYSRVQQLAADVRRTSNDDAADALLSLFTAPDASALTAV